MLVDNFQDLPIGLEDEHVTGYTEALAWDYGIDSIGDREDDTAERKDIQSAASYPGVSWITFARDGAGGLVAPREAPGRSCNCHGGDK